MTEFKLKFQPQTVAQAVIFSEAHLRSIGRPELSLLAFVKEVSAESDPVVASKISLTQLREQEVIPGLRLKSGTSILEIVRVIPTNREVVYKTNRGGLYRMPTEKFVKLARQQGYKKIWNIKNFLITLKALLKPVLDAVPLMWVLKWILNMIRVRPGVRFASKLPKPADVLEK